MSGENFIHFANNVIAMKWTQTALQPRDYEQHWGGASELRSMKIKMMNCHMRVGS